MAQLSVHNLSGKSVGKVDVSDDVFGAEVKEHLLWEVVRAQRTRARAGTAHTKTRAEIARTKDKVYRQKGTGNARHGSKRSNVFRGGGVVHGPRVHQRSIHVNKKVMAGALRSALSLRAKAGDLVVVKAFEGKETKTKLLAASLDKLKAPKALLVDAAGNDWLKLTSRNLPDASFLADGGLNVYDILKYPKLIISEEAIKRVDERLGGGK